MQQNKIWNKSLVIKFYVEGKDGFGWNICGVEKWAISVAGLCHDTIQIKYAALVSSGQ